MRQSRFVHALNYSRNFILERMGPPILWDAPQSRVKALSTLPGLQTVGGPISPFRLLAWQDRCGVLRCQRRGNFNGI